MGASKPASEWMCLELLCPLDGALASIDWTEIAGFLAARSRWARLAGFEIRRCFRGLCFGLPGETESGSAEEQPDKG